MVVQDDGPADGSAPDAAPSGRPQRAAARPPLNSNGSGGGDGSRSSSGNGADARGSINTNKKAAAAQRSAKKQKQQVKKEKEKEKGADKKKKTKGEKEADRARQEDLSARNEKVVAQAEEKLRKWLAAFRKNPKAWAKGENDNWCRYCGASKASGWGVRQVRELEDEYSRTDDR